MNQRQMVFRLQNVHIYFPPNLNSIDRSIALIESQIREIIGASVNRVRRIRFRCVSSMSIGSTAIDRISDCIARVSSIVQSSNVFRFRAIRRVSMSIRSDTLQGGMNTSIFRSSIMRSIIELHNHETLYLDKDDGSIEGFLSWSYGSKKSRPIDTNSSDMQFCCGVQTSNSIRSSIQITISITNTHSFNCFKFNKKCRRNASVDVA